jgi:hypothetical protein
MESRMKTILTEQEVLAALPGTVEKVLANIGFSLPSQSLIDNATSIIKDLEVASKVQGFYIKGAIHYYSTTRLPIMQLTQADVGKRVVSGTPINPEDVQEEYPEQVGTILQVHNLGAFDYNPGDQDWAMIQIDPDQNWDIEQWHKDGSLVLVPEGGRMDPIATPFCCILRYA